MEKTTSKSKGWSLGPQPEHKKVKGKPSCIICPKCHAVYFDKHWHNATELDNADCASKEIIHELCPEDKEMEKGHGVMGYEGEVILKNVPSELSVEIVQEIRNIGKRAELRDPEDRIIKIENTAGTIHILTTENQLAVGIAKQVARAHKGGTLEIKWSNGDKTARAVWEFKK